MGLELPPAGARRLQDGVAERFRWLGGWGAVIPSTADPGKPSRPGPGRQGRSSGRALHLVTLALARSTVCGSAADGMTSVGQPTRFLLSLNSFSSSSHADVMALKSTRGYDPR